MTITYTGKVANARLLGFSRLLLYWKGSIYKLMYKEILIFITLYGGLSIIYRNALNESQKRWFEKAALYCELFSNLIPLSFVLGFYVSIVVARWWNQFMNIPWPDRVMFYTSLYIQGVDDRSRVIRRQLMRYLSLSSLFVFQATSINVKKRFPTMDHLVEAGVVTPTEVQILEEVQTPHGKWWVPFAWVTELLRTARKEGRITNDFVLKSLMDEFMVYRGQLGMLYNYDWISIPLVYTQVATLSAYSFFIGAIFGRQFLDPKQGYPGYEVDIYVPFFTILQFFFYMGWLKVAEQLINPFGEDDDDFNMNWVIDRNLQISLLNVDDLHGHRPALIKDLYYGEVPPENLPYTKSTIKTMRDPYLGSTADLSVSPDGMKVVNPMETIQEGDGAPDKTAHHAIFSRSSHTSIPNSVSASPSKHRHPWYLRGGLRHSKSSLDGGSFDGREIQYLNGVGLFSRHGSRMNNIGEDSMGIPLSPEDEVDGDEVSAMFQMDMEDTNAYKPCYYGGNTPVIPNPDVERLKLEEAGLGHMPPSSLALDLERRLTSGLMRSPVSPDRNDVDQMPESVPKVCVASGRTQQGASFTNFSRGRPATPNPFSSTPVHTPATPNPFSSTQAHTPAIQNLHKATSVTIEMDDGLEADTKDEMLRFRNPSGSSGKSASCGSLIHMDSNQSTTNSDAPLLESSSSEEFA